MSGFCIYHSCDRSSSIDDLQLLVCHFYSPFRVSTLLSWLKRSPKQATSRWNRREGSVFQVPLRPFTGTKIGLVTFRPPQFTTVVNYCIRWGVIHKVRLNHCLTVLLKSLSFRGSILEPPVHFFYDSNPFVHKVHLFVKFLGVRITIFLRGIYGSLTNSCPNSVVLVLSCSLYLILNMFQ